MSERFLVLRGLRIQYDSGYYDIQCITDEDWFEVRGVKPSEVIAEGARIKRYGDGAYQIIGNELWSDGEKFIIRIGDEGE